MNVDNQILQLCKRRDKIITKLDKILCRVRSPDYLTKVPSHIRQQMDNKVRTGAPVLFRIELIIYRQTDLGKDILFVTLKEL